MAQRKFKLGREVNLLDIYPRQDRPIEERFKTVTVRDRLLARQFNKEYFDGTRNQGYGGYRYHPKFWQPVVKKMKNYYKLTSQSKILDVGCGKGFMMHDFRTIIPGITIQGIDISKYAIENALSNIKPFIHLGNAKELAYPDKTFDLVIAINSIHNLPLEDCFTALQEMERVSKKYKFLVVDAWDNEEERQRLMKWNLTAQTILSTKDWKELFKLAEYSGDFYWFAP